MFYHLNGEIKKICISVSYYFSCSTNFSKEVKDKTCNFGGKNNEKQKRKVQVSSTMPSNRNII